MVSETNTFDVGNGYKRIGFREDRDLLDTELNELQEIAIYERTVLLDRLFAPGSIVAGLDGTVNGDTVTLAAGIVYLDGHAVSVPAVTLSFPDPGVHTIWLDVFRRIISATDDPTLVNPLTGEPTAEREKWIATLQTRDTTADPLPTGATGRTVVALYTFHRDTGELLPTVPHVVQPDDPTTWMSHIGHGGVDQHPVVTPTKAGFMAPADKTILDQLSTTPPAHTHDDRYYTEAAVDTQLATKADVGHQHDARYAPLAHVGAAGAAHPTATAEQPGFLSATDKAKLDGMAAGSTRGQRTATLVVAASTASEAGKAAADFVCDGIDDQVELNAARAALQALGGGKLVLTEGTFTLSGRFRLCSHLLVEGQGQATVLKVSVPQSFTGGMISTDDEIDPTPTNITIRDLALDGSRPALPANSNGSSAIHFGGVDGGLLENLDAAHFQYAGTAIYVAACVNVVVRTCRSHDNDGCGIMLHDSCRHCLVDGNLCYRNGLHGISLAIAQDCAVQQNICWNNGQTTDNRYANLYLGYDVAWCNVQGNTCRYHDTAIRPNAGIEIVDGTNTINNLVTNNDLLNGGVTSLLNHDVETVTTAGNRVGTY